MNIILGQHKAEWYHDDKNLETRHQQILFTKTHDGTYGQHLKNQDRIQLRRTFSLALKVKKLQSYKIQFVKMSRLAEGESEKEVVSPQEPKTECVEKSKKPAQFLKATEK